jgi:hypothetical protein
VISVLIVDDHALVRAGVVARLAGEADIAPIGEAGTVAGALSLAKRLQPDLVPLDLMLRRRPRASCECGGPPCSPTGCQSPAHWPDFGPDVELGWPALVGAGELPVQDSGPLMWLPETIVEPVLFCRTSGPATVAPSIVT